MSLLLLAIACSLGSACITQKQPPPEKVVTSPGATLCIDIFPVPEGLGRLSAKLEDDLFGQPLAVKHIVNSFKAHWTTDEPRKALVLSFHGSAGTGKSFVAAKLIPGALFRADIHSPSLVYILGSAFEDGDPVKQKTVLLEKVRRQVKECPRTVTVIDDADQLGEGVLDSLLPMMEFHESVGGIDYRKSGFVIVSSSGGKEVNDVAIEKQALPRHELHLKDFEKPITNAVFNSQGRLRKSQLISRGLIDKFVPFLPLSRLYVEQCIRNHLRHSGRQSDEGVVFDVAASLQYFHNDFSSSGCKKVASRTDSRLLEVREDL